MRVRTRWGNGKFVSPRPRNSTFQPDDSDYLELVCLYPNLWEQLPVTQQGWDMATVLTMAKGKKSSIMKVQLETEKN